MHSSSAITKYLNRPAEQFVLEGYRSIAHGIAEKRIEFWEEFDRSVAIRLGDVAAQPLLVALHELVIELGRCAVCPLRMQDLHARSICRDESLIMALIAATQIGDDETVKICTRSLACPSQYARIAAKAGILAALLKANGLILLPIPLSAVSEILNTTAEQMPWTSSTTLH